MVNMIYEVNWTVTQVYTTRKLFWTILLWKIKCETFKNLYMTIEYYIV